MADAEVRILLKNLKQLLLYNADLLFGVKEQVESLHMVLKLMEQFLEDLKEKHSEYEYVRELVRQIRDVAYEAEDTIDRLVASAVMEKERSTLSRSLHVFDRIAKLRSVAKDIEFIKKKWKLIFVTKSNTRALYAGESSKKSSSFLFSTVREENIVIGFDEEAKEVVSRLTNATKSLEVVSIVGMGGLGKTALASKVYRDPAIKCYFKVCAWVCVSEIFDLKKVFLAILYSLVKPSDQRNIDQINEEMIVEEIFKQLKGQRYLIVLDDVWTTDAWNDLKTAFPNQDCGSRILLTTRNTNVALIANPKTPPHHLRFLNEDESFELFCTKLFSEKSCPYSELDELGRTIAKNCAGLPLAIVVIAQLLRVKEKTRYIWKNVAENVGSYVASEPCLNALALSYLDLPDHLKVCFIYFGAFPKGYPIPVRKLVMLWVAEGFIQPNGQGCLEDIAEQYLDDLVQRNLILTIKKGANGRIKTCQVHDMLRDLCINKAEEEKFLQVINRNLQDPDSPVPTGNYSRLCVHSHVMNYILSKPCDSRVRSFLCFPSEEIELSIEHTSFVRKAFKLVRVLEMRSLKFTRFPAEITQLVHLRYIAIFGNFDVLPSAISKLWSLQSLIVKTAARDLDIQVDIWKMSQFRHLHTNGPSRLHGPQAKTHMDNKNSSVQANIQTISTISPDSCTENILARTPDLKKLGIRGKLVILMEEKNNSSLFHNLAKLDNLEKLKLLNDTFEGKLINLPPLDKFPPHLNKLTLSDTFLDWKHMSTIALLPFLEVLKLKMNAFEGRQWDPVDGGFRLLKYLKIGKTDLVEWKALGHHFPRLEHVVVEHCGDLVEIPRGLADVSALQTIELHHTPRAVASARLIHQQKQMQQHVKSNGFKLLVNPPE